MNAATDTEPGSVELRIEGDIVDDEDVWLYELMGLKATSPNAFRDELAQYAGQDITVWIDSYGGSVFAGAGIYNALKEHKGTVNVKIDGKAISAASVIAMAGDKIEMSPVAIMMIHNPFLGAVGDARDLRHAADVLDTVKDAIINAYQLKTGRARNKISSMMDDETWMSARTAIKEGFADGMLYTDKPEGQPADGALDFAFNRHAILNSANAGIKRLFDVERKIQAADNGAKMKVLKAKLALAAAPLAIQIQGGNKHE